MDNDIAILVVDDERDHADGLAEALGKLGAKTIAVYNGKDALDILARQTIDIVVTDLKLGGDFDGLAILEQAKKLNSQTEVILITAYATVDTCKKAIRQGAYDYLVKPIDIDQLRTLVEQAGRKITKANSYMRKPSSTGRASFEFEGVRCQSPQMEGIFEVLRRVAPTDISILVEGDSGTGKELLARAIHKNSNRRNKPFKPINCAGLTETLLESELFGHTKGAFTGAAGDRKGLFEIADKGTLFLDEIGEMDLSVQAKLLRVIQERQFTRVGGLESIDIDFRLITASNRDLGKEIKAGNFRSDLYYRINVITIKSPPLR
ncbi:MAG: sigma-54-dependent Fis family transcriptional regulator, partial [Planctomycetes bacterium]|nr:sigma-54-dependent Fis family transcriptional regulator [Planctomycetota bacterium]